MPNCFPAPRNEAERFAGTIRTYGLPKRVTSRSSPPATASSRFAFRRNDPNVTVFMPDNMSDNRHLAEPQFENISTLVAMPRRTLFLAGSRSLKKKRAERNTRALIPIFALYCNGFGLGNDLLFCHSPSKIYGHKCLTPDHGCPNFELPDVRGACRLGRRRLRTLRRAARHCGLSFVFRPDFSGRKVLFALRREGGANRKCRGLGSPLSARPWHHGIGDGGQH